MEMNWDEIARKGHQFELKLRPQPVADVGPASEPARAVSVLPMYWGLNDALGLGPLEAGRWMQSTFP